MSKTNKFPEEDTGAFWIASFTFGILLVITSCLFLVL